MYIIVVYLYHNLLPLLGKFERGKKMKKGLRKNKKGFTLVELIIVIAILAILAAVAVPSFLGLQDEAKKGRATGNATAIVTAINAYNALYPDARITSAGTTDIAKVKAKNLWPQGMGTYETEALALVKVDGTTGVATVDTTASPAASGT